MDLAAAKRWTLSLLIALSLVTIVAVDFPGLTPFGSLFTGVSQVTGIGVRRPLFRAPPERLDAMAEFSDGSEAPLHSLLNPVRRELIDFRWTRLLARMNADSPPDEWSPLCQRFADARTPLELVAIRLSGHTQPCPD